MAARQTEDADEIKAFKKRLKTALEKWKDVHGSPVSGIPKGTWDGLMYKEMALPSVPILMKLKDRVNLTFLFYGRGKPLQETWSPEEAEHFHRLYRPLEEFLGYGGSFVGKVPGQVGYYASLLWNIVRKIQKGVRLDISEAYVLTLLARIRLKDLKDITADMPDTLDEIEKRLPAGKKWTFRLYRVKKHSEGTGERGPWAKIEKAYEQAGFAFYSDHLPYICDLHGQVYWHRCPSCLNTKETAARTDGSADNAADETYDVTTEDSLEGNLRILREMAERDLNGFSEDRMVELVRKVYREKNPD